MSWPVCVAAMKDRLLDHDDKVRIAVVKAFYDLAISNLNLVPTELLRLAAERLRDKKVLAQVLFLLSFNVLCCLENQRSVAK